MTLALARLMLEEGHPDEAYDELCAAPQVEVEGGPTGGGCGSGAYERAALLGGIRHRQWHEAMQEAADTSVRRQGRPSQASQSQQHSHFSQSQPGSQRAQGEGASRPWDVYSHNPGVVARAGRAAQELAQSAAQHLRRALELCPGATQAAVKLVQLALAQRQRDGEQGGSDDWPALILCWSRLNTPQHACRSLLCAQKRCAWPGRSAARRHTTPTPMPPACCSFSASPP